jgi:hypothetical protein
VTNDLVVVCWDGKSEPLGAIRFDADPQFDLLVFDYSGGGAMPAGHRYGSNLLSRRTEAKGQVFLELVRHVGRSGRAYGYVGIIDDDIMMKISDIDFMFHVAQLHKLDSFAPALSRDSAFTHDHTLRRDNVVFHHVPWVEVMAPFYRMQLFMAAAEMYPQSISSWGIDCFAMPLFQRVTKMTNVAVIDAVMAMHMRPHDSHARRLSNGKFPRQEMAHICRLCMKYVAEKHPAWVDSDWYRDTFAGTHARIAGSPLPAT